MRSLRFENRFFSVETDGEALSIRTPDGKTVIDRFDFSFQACSIHNPRAPVIGPTDRIWVDRIDGLCVGDTIQIVQDIYGGAARSRKTYETRIVGFSDEEDIVFSPALPKGHFTNDLGIYVLKVGETVSNYRLLSVDEISSPNGKTLKIERDCGDFDMNIEIRCTDDSLRITFDVTCNYKREIELYRQSFVVSGPLALNEIYLKNRKAERVGTVPAGDRYWLWKEGAKFSDGRWCWFTCHNPQVALVELKRARSDRPELWFHLQHYSSQRYRRLVALYPMQFTEFKELSAPHFRSGDSASQRFQLYVGPEPANPPRLMLSPEGFLATHIWTEHADKAHIRSHRAVYFGHEDITDASRAIGGFVRYGHRVTKSIFYHNREGVPNPPSENGLKGEFGEMVSVVGSEDFRVFLDQLRELGHEICLHTAAPHEQTAQAEAESVREVSQRFKSRTWIDHDMEYKKVCFSSNGLLSDPQNSMVESWRKNEITYFWHWSSEDYMLKNGRNLNLLHSGNGTYTPSPVYWRHPTVLGEFVSWGSHESYFEHFTRDSIDRLVEDRGISIHHGYYPFLCRETKSFQYYFRDLDGKLVATPKFNEVLSYMSRLREQKQLYLGTVGELMDYWVALEKVRIDLTSDRVFRITNESEKAISGLSFVIHSQSIDRTSRSVAQRAFGDGEILVWLDLGPGATLEFVGQP